MLKKNIAFIWVSLTVFIVILYVVLRVFVISSFIELENQSTLRNVERALNALTEQTMNLNAKASDWAAWDDAYQFVQDGNPAFIRSNIVLSAFTGNNLNLIAYIRDTGEIVYARWYHPGAESLVPIPEDVRRTIYREGLLITHRDVRDSVSGIVMLQQGPMLVASRPVVTSFEEGPIRGSLIFGELLDSAEVQNLSRITRVSITIERLDDSDLPADFAQARNEISEDGQVIMKPLSRRVVAGYTILDDIYGEPVLLLRVEMPRTLYNRGLTITNYMLAMLVILSILFGLIGSLLLVRTIQKEHEFDRKTREFYRSTIEAATGGKLIICEQECIPHMGESLGRWEALHAEDVSSVRSEVTDIAQCEGMKDQSLSDFILCVGEAITNAVKHGGGGIALLYRIDHGLLFKVTDRGPGIEALAIPELALKARYTTVASLGVGYKVMVSLADKVYLATGPQGTTVALEKKIDGVRPEEEAHWIPDTWNM